MYNNEGTGQIVQSNKPKKKRESVRFAPKIVEARNEREDKIEVLQKDILSLIEKNKIDDRDAKIALLKVSKLINARCKL